MGKENIPHFYTINWDFNGDKLEFYDVMPYFADCWKEEEDREIKIWNTSFNTDKDKENAQKMPETFDDFKKFIKRCSFDTFWGNCNYECIVTGWPVSKDNHKLDVHEQVMANIDVITHLFIEYIKNTEITKK